MLERGIVFRARRLLNWCASCGTVLANEQVNDSRCWRCDNPVVLREFEQWFLKITDYAQELLDGLDDLPDWPERVRTMQRHWIGRSEGAKVFFAVEGLDAAIEVFTTRIDTIHGATYVALAVEHPLLARLAAGTPQESAVAAFVAAQTGRPVEDRFAEAAEKLGVFTGRHAVNPFSGEKIPIWAANFVLHDVGTGAIMSVPAHDDRDFAFARSTDLPIRPSSARWKAGPLRHTHRAGHSRRRSSSTPRGCTTGSDSAAARERMVGDAAARGFGSKTVTFRLKGLGRVAPALLGNADSDRPLRVLRDRPRARRGASRAASRQRAPDGVWGSPLAQIAEFVETTCPHCGEPARRETDTMDTFVGLVLVLLPLLRSTERRGALRLDEGVPWFPVGLYIGGIEHATMHLIYTRFFTMVMRDLGLVTIDEPVSALFHARDGREGRREDVEVQGQRRRSGRDGRALRRRHDAVVFPVRGASGARSRVERGGGGRVLPVPRPALADVREGEAVDPLRRSARASRGRLGEALALRRKTHQTIRRVTDDLGPRMHLNTPVAAIMELLNMATPLVSAEAIGEGEAWAVREAFEVIAPDRCPRSRPTSPRSCGRRWASPLRRHAAWPSADEALLVQARRCCSSSGQRPVRGKLTIPRGRPRPAPSTRRARDSKLAAYLDGHAVRKIVFVPDRLLNVVLG
jgi:leucyl-tRNA synthetase